MEASMYTNKIDKRARTDSEESQNRKTEEGETRVENLQQLDVRMKERKTKKEREMRCSDIKSS